MKNEFELEAIARRIAELEEQVSVLDDDDIRSYYFKDVNYLFARIRELEGR